MKRKKILINPRFQLKFVSWMLAFECAIIVVFYGANLHFFKHYLMLAKSANLGEDHIFISFLNSQYHHMNWIFLIATVVITIAIILFSLIFSHRIAGPLHRLVAHMKKLDPNQPFDTFKLRSSDYFVEVGEVYNKQVKMLIDDRK